MVLNYILGGSPRRYVKVVVRTALLKQQDLDTAVIIKVSALSSTSGNSGLIADSFKPRGKNLGTWDILVNFLTGLLLYSLRHLCLLKFSPKDKCDVMLIYFILLGEEVGGGRGGRRVALSEEATRPGGCSKMFYTRGFRPCPFIFHF